MVFPEAIPAERLARLGARPPKLVRYPGIKEEYYLADFEPDPAVVEGIDPAKVLVVVRTPPEVSLYHRHGNPLFPDVLERLGRDECVHAVVLPRTAEQREAIRALGLPSLHVPEHAVDAQSLIALADLVVSAGGTMNREAVALGTPVYTTFAGRLGAVDELADRAKDGCDRSRTQARSNCASATPAGRLASVAIRGCCSGFFFRATTGHRDRERKPATGEQRGISACVRLFATAVLAAGLATFVAATAANSGSPGFKTARGR